LACTSPICLQGCSSTAYVIMYSMLAAFAQVAVMISPSRRTLTRTERAWTTTFLSSPALPVWESHVQRVCDPVDSQLLPRRIRPYNRHTPLYGSGTTLIAGMMMHSVSGVAVGKHADIPLGLLAKKNILNVIRTATLSQITWLVCREEVVLGIRLADRPSWKIIFASPMH
jgi:hypothetical protein